MLILHLVACKNNQNSNTLTNSGILVIDSFNSNGTRINYVSKGKGEPIILIHGFLHHAQPKDARVEVHIALGIASDGGDVMDAFQLHLSFLSRLAGIESLLRQVYSESDCVYNDFK